ncbi:hypothetical protein, partial [Streptomyces sp. NPDC006274]|uniref:hypothetical protein n=1 Tax=unclassified Streptomyces TaxID=2593676 RepID=UPI0033AF5C9E
MGREISRYDARPGDVIFGYYRTSKAWNHTGVVTAAKGGASMSFVKASLSGLGWFGVAGAMRRVRRPR